MVKLLVHKAPLELPYVMNATLVTLLLRIPFHMLNVKITNNGVTLHHLAMVFKIINDYWPACLSKSLKIDLKNI
jgi:hypothetical protein